MTLFKSHGRDDCPISLWDVESLFVKSVNSDTCEVVIHVLLAMMYYCWGILVHVYKNRISYSYWKCWGCLM